MHDEFKLVAAETVDQKGFCSQCHVALELTGESEVSGVCVSCRDGLPEEYICSECNRYWSPELTATDCVTCASCLEHFLQPDIDSLEDEIEGIRQRITWMEYAIDAAKEGDTKAALYCFRLAQ